MRALVLLAFALTGSEATAAISLKFTHPDGELVDRGSITAHVSADAAWDCSSTSSVDVAAKRITLTGGAAPPGPPINCFAPWIAVLPPLPPGTYEVTARLATTGGGLVDSTTRTLEVMPVDGRCNASPGLVPTLWAVHRSLEPADVAAKVASDAAYAALLGNPIVGRSGIVSTEYHREYAALGYPPLDDPTAVSARLYESGEFVLVSRNGHVCFAPPPLDSVATFVEYYHAGLDRYFYTGNASEIAAIDAGKVGPWTRTGKSFRAVGAPGCIPHSADTVVYRFSGIPGKGPSSHFFTRDRSECHAVDKSAKWLLEGIPFYASPVKAGGTCEASATVYPASPRLPLYRLWRPFGDSNHRFTTERAVVDEMVTKGWIDEGAAMCVLAP